MRSEEDTAVRMLKQYAAAQHAFKADNLAMVPGNTIRSAGFCDAFRNLHYGKDREGRLLKRIYRDMADAAAGAAGTSQTRYSESMMPPAFRGFRYLEDPYVTENSLWETHFGLAAYPEAKTPAVRRSYDVFWIGRDGVILTRSYDSWNAALLTSEDSPLHPEGNEHWRLSAG